MNIISVYTTFADMGEAKKVASFLVKEKLVACANLINCESIYLWKEGREEAAEVVGIFKTVEEKFPKLAQEIKRLSSYESPAIYSSKVDLASTDTETWLTEVLGF